MASGIESGKGYIIGMFFRWVFSVSKKRIITRSEMGKGVSKLIFVFQKGKKCLEKWI